MNTLILKRIEKSISSENNSIIILNAYFCYDDNPEEKKLWFSFSREYEDAIITELSDAILIAISAICARRGIHIKSEVPASRPILCNLEAMLSLLVYENPDEYSKITIDSPIDHSWYRLFPAERNWAFASGSCGVDAMHTLMMCEKSNFAHRPTHLIFNNTGSSDIGEGSSALLSGRILHAKKFCQNYSYQFVYVNSNFYDFFHFHYSLTNFYVNIAIGYMLGKKAEIYYYSSGYVASQVTFKGDPAHAEAILTGYVSSPYFQILHVANDFIQRFEKVKDLVNYEPANSFLNVCFNHVENCGICEKCRRVLMALECCNAIDRFKPCFNIDQYKKNKITVWRNLIIDHYHGDSFIAEMWNEFKHRLTFPMYLRAWLWMGYLWILKQHWFEAANHMRHYFFCHK